MTGPGSEEDAVLGSAKTHDLLLHGLNGGWPFLESELVSIKDCVRRECW
jgi:hypothetical protein